MIRRPPRSTHCISSAASDVYKRQLYVNTKAPTFLDMLNTTDQPLATLPASVVRPGREVLEQVMEELR